MSRLSFIRFDKSFQMIFAEQPFRKAREALVWGVSDPDDIFNHASSEMEQTIGCDISLEKCDVGVLKPKGQNYGLICNISEQDKRFVISFILQDNSNGHRSLVGQLHDIDRIGHLEEMMAKHFTMKDFPLEEVYQEICREVDVRMSRKMGCGVYADDNYELTILSPAIAH